MMVVVTVQCVYKAQEASFDDGCGDCAVCVQSITGQLG